MMLGMADDNMKALKSPVAIQKMIRSRFEDEFVMVF
tara:strand:- start:44439 stop:44546 length:108 start_codon:yes stop_codon:yes gene_type:complete